MKYELVPKDVLDEVYGALNEANKLLETGDKEFRVEAKTWVKRAQSSLERNRRQCNVKPEDE